MRQPCEASDQHGLGRACRTDLRRIEDAAHGLRWLELAGAPRLHMRGSLVPQVASSLIGEGRTAAAYNAGEHGLFL